MKFLKNRPVNDFDKNNPEKQFWTDGIKVYFGKTSLRGANPKTFLYDGIFGKDEKNCFCGESWIKDADTKTFKVLNYTYAIDKNFVHTITGKVKDADITSFKILDDGKFLLWFNRVGIPEYTFYGYAKDKNNVYYHNYQGKPKIIRKAAVDSFSSFNDGYFARDKNNIYGNGKIIKKADIKNWQKISNLANSLYSKDNKRIFYGFWEIQVDYETFKLEIPKNAKYCNRQIASDKNYFYENGEIITRERFDKLNEINDTTHNKYLST